MFRSRLKIPILVFIALTGLLLGAAPAKAQVSPWLGSAALTLHKETDITATPPSINGNIDCVPDGPYDCVIQTLYGSMNQNSGLKLNNSQPYRSFMASDNHPHTIGVPNSDTLLTYSTDAAYGFNLYFTRDAAAAISLKNPAGGQPYYQVNRLYDAKLADKDGHRLAGDYQSISFSANGEWMVVSEPNVAMLRVNLTTFEVLPFAKGFNYTIGLSVSPHAAISDDGRYAVVATTDGGGFNVYDLDTCGPPPSTILGPASGCQSRTLETFMSLQIPGFINASNIHFINDDTIGFFGSLKSGTAIKTAKYVLANQSGLLSQLNYLAVGDSYISGEGSFNYMEGTDNGNSHCHLSPNSYPYQIGLDLDYDAFHSVACSGAKIKDVIDTSSVYQSQNIPKTSREKLDKNGQSQQILAYFLPGYIDQLDFVKTYRPQAVTVSIGGNDIGFSSILTRCVAGNDTCFNSYEDRLELVREINSQFPRLVATYSQLKTRGSSAAKVYVIGYPQIAKPGGDCGDNVRLDANEVLFSKQVIEYLDSVIKAAAARAGVVYVDTQSTFDGNRLCEGTDGEFAMNGLTVGNDRPDFFNGPIGAESYHPTKLGYKLLETRILASTSRLTLDMPSADSSAAPPPETGLEILNVQHTGRAVLPIHFSGSLTNDVLIKGSSANVAADGDEFSLMPSAAYRAEIHSSPIVMGNFSTDASGDLNFQILIPATIPAGMHTLHIYMAKR